MSRKCRETWGIIFSGYSSNFLITVTLYAAWKPKARKNIYH